MNLTHLKKLSEDDDYFHVQDTRAGDSFRVAKKGLSAELHGQIAQHFSEGGLAESAAQWAKAHPGEDIMPDQFPGLSAKERFDAMESSKPAGAGFNPASALQAVKDWAHKDAPDSTPAPGGFTPAPASADPGPQPGVNMSSVDGPPPAETPPAAPAPPVAPPPQPGTGGAGPSGMPSGGTSGFDKTMAQNLAAQQGGAQTQADLAGQVAAANIASQEAARAKAEQSQAYYANLMKKNAQDIEKTQGDIASGKIDGDRWWASRNVGQKIAGTIGLILGGIGHAFGGGPNAALALIDKAVAQDVEIQKAELGKKENQLSRYIQQGHSLQEAMQLTDAHNKAALAGQIEINAAKFAGPKAQAEAQALKGKLGQEVAEKIQDAHIKSSKNAIDMMEARAKLAAMGAKQNGAVAPGYMRGNIPIKDEEASAFRGALAAQQDISSAAAELDSLAAAHGTEAFNSDAGKKMAALESKIKLKIKDLAKLGALSASDLELMQSQVPTFNTAKPEWWNNGRATLKQLVANTRGSLDSQARSMGLVRTAQPGQPTGALVTD